MAPSRTPSQHEIPLAIAVVSFGPDFTPANHP